MGSDELPLSGMRARLANADTVQDTLAAGFDAFELIRAAAQDRGDHGGRSFATWAMTAAEAADGRDVLAFAPSLPKNETAPPSANVMNGDHAGVPGGDQEDQAADVLAALAACLADELAATAARASEDADKTACERAAQHAARIRELLAREG